MTRYCVQCGEPLGPYDRYCLVCGAETRNPEPREEEPEPVSESEPETEPEPEYTPPQQAPPQPPVRPYTPPQPPAREYIPPHEPPRQRRKRWPIVLGCSIGALVITLIIVLTATGKAPDEQAKASEAPIGTQTQMLAPTLNLVVGDTNEIAPTPPPSNETQEPSPTQEESVVTESADFEQPSPDVVPVTQGFGNTGNNAYAGGLSVAAQDGRIYALSNQNGTTRILSMDGADDAKVLPDVQDALYINDGADGYIYFQENQDGPSIKRVKTDGSASPDIIISGAIMPLRVREEILYISTRDNTLNAYRTDTGETRQICDTAVGAYFYAEGLIYFCDAARENAICAVEANGGSPAIVRAGPAYNPTIAGGFLYYTDKPTAEPGATLYRVDLGGSDASPVINDISGAYLAHPDWIVYSAQGGLYVYNIAENTHTLISEDQAVMLSQSGEFLFYAKQDKQINALMFYW